MNRNGLTSGRRIAAMRDFLARMPGAKEEPVLAPRGTAPVALMFKVMGKMFAVLAVREEEYVILKCDPALIDILRGQYAGIGHRSHLDPRHWIAVALDGDVPAKEIRSLAQRSYDLICTGLTRKQKAALSDLAGS